MSRFVLLALVALASAGFAGAQTKVGVINTQKAMLDTVEIKKDQAAMEAKYKPRQDQMSRLQQELAGLQAQINGGRMTPAAQQQATLEGQRKERELQRLQQDLQDDVDRERNDILGRTGKRMQEIVNRLATEKGLDVVIDAANTVFFKPALDLTAEATAAYDKAYPVSASSTAGPAPAASK